MLKDITLGQYFPSNTVVHRLDPRTKIVLCIVYIVCLFQANTWLAYGLVLALTLSVMALSKIKPSAILKGLKPLIIIIALTCLLNLFYTKGTPIREGWPITYEGIERAVQMILRIVLLIAGTFILTYTTSPIELTDGLELLLNPLKRLKFPVHEVSMMMSLALRFIPTLIEETDKIMSAQKARGADFESGNLIQRAKALLPVLVPLFVSAFRYSLPVIPLKTFTVKEGSYVEFTGDPMNPKLNITATERVKANVADESGATRSVAFDCGVIITKTLNDMGLEFTIDAPEDQTISGELVTMSKEERGKIAVAMLTTGMYLADGNTGSFSMNNALSSFLQSEINSIAGSALKTLDVSLGIDNSTDATGAQRTDYSFKFAKRFFNNRLKIELGGKVSSGASDAMGNNQSFFDNVTMEYRLNQDATKNLKVFYNQNVYDWLEGYTGEYGIGFVWRRKLNSLLDILTFWKNEPRPTMAPRTSLTAPRDSLRTDSVRVKR
ncbi:MAG: translocation/assembly module TamB domain-containing protein [Oscillospiraceae bacterium]|nr:translocation/assembly module TamB domain-containing protein [Oscillospiraceae bacterium]